MPKTKIAEEICCKWSTRISHTWQFSLDDALIIYKKIINGMSTVSSTSYASTILMDRLFTQVIDETLH